MSQAEYLCDIYDSAKRAEAIRFVHRMMRDAHTARMLGEYETSNLCLAEAKLVAHRYNL